jgi:hypothetical protein
MEVIFVASQGKDSHGRKWEKRNFGWVGGWLASGM